MSALYSNHNYLSPHTAVSQPISSGPGGVTSPARHATRAFPTIFSPQEAQTLQFSTYFVFSSRAGQEQPLAISSPILSTPLQLSTTAIMYALQSGPSASPTTVTNRTPAIASGGNVTNCDQHCWYSLSSGCSLSSLALFSSLSSLLLSFLSEILP